MDWIWEGSADENEEVGVRGEKKSGPEGRASVRLMKSGEFAPGVLALEN